MSKSRELFALSAETTDDLRRLSARACVTLPATLLAVAGVLVSRYTGWDDVTLLVADEPLVSLNLSGNPTFRQVLGRVRAAWSAEPCDRDYLEIVLASALQRHTFVHPVARNAAHDSRPDRTVTLGFELAQAAIRGVLEYDADQYDARVMRAAASHAIRIAAAAAADESVRVSAIDMLTTEERDRLRAWNDTACGYPAGTLASLFEEQAAHAPDAVALRYRGRTLTYGELDARATRLARFLRAKGVARAVRVGLSFDRSPDAIVAILGILKAGGAYVPLDRDFPEQRLRETVEDAGLCLIVGSRRLPWPFSTWGLEFAWLEDGEAFAGDEGPLTSGAGPDDTAYVMYTSGSTGRPKGIVGSHRSVINGLNNLPLRRHDPDEICCLNSSLSVGFSLSRLFLPLLCGLPLVIVPDGDEKDPARLVGVLEDERVTNLALVTPALRQLLRSGLAARLWRVHTVGIGGATLTADVIDAFRASMPQATLLHAYGSTEIGGAALVGAVTGSTRFTAQSVGRPFANTQVYVVDPAMNLQPIGVAGEICVASPHLAHGYLSQAELTARRFVRNPFGSGRLYRTGDVGRFLPDGDVELLGRIDDQVKIRGYRVELSEVEAALAAHADVEQAAVAAHAIDGDTRLFAYVVARGGSSLEAAALREYVAERLPAYMQPSSVSWVDALPMTPSGKVDRTALAPPHPEQLVSSTGYVAPRGEIEQAIAAIWTVAFGLERIGSDVHFLELGGDSLTAAQLAARIGQRFELDVPATQVLSEPTIAALAKYVEKALAA